jgi:hypothetical protein
MTIVADRYADGDCRSAVLASSDRHSFRGQAIVRQHDCILGGGDAPVCGQKKRRRLQNQIIP